MHMAAPHSSLRRLGIFALLAPLSACSLVHAPLRALGGDLSFIGSSFGVPGQNASFDYVIIGGGTAGLAMALRLAQDASTSVAVVEAGGFAQIDNGNLTVIPADAIHFAGSDPTDTQPLVDWGFVTTPQEGVNNREMHYARGKCLGGSSARNIMAYQRGSNDSYARWASEVGDDDYQFDSLLPFFKRSVTFTPPHDHIRAANASVSYNYDAFSKQGGPVQISFAKWANPFSSWFLQGLTEIGVRRAVDFVSGTLMGVQYQMNTLDPLDQTRSSSDASYLKKALAETDLTVYKSTLAKKILFNHNKTATGVVVNTAGTTYQLDANKEVILSAGAFQSPQLLMVSGIGPAETLKKFNINVVSELPGVGQNMWDHFFFGPSYRVDVTTHSSLGNPHFRHNATLEYRSHQKGILGNSGGDIFGWEKLPEPQRNTLSNSTRHALAQFPPGWPELEYIAIDAYIGRQLNYIQGAPKTPYNYAAPVAALVAPLSRGNVTIASADAADAPLINPNWLSDPADQELAVAAYRRIRQLMDLPALQNVTVGQEVYPGRHIETDAQILETIKESGQTVWHAAATCKMGRKSDRMAVLDSKARVFGVNSLRVVDASSFPFLPPGHPTATVYALAEKIASDILLGR